MNVRTVETAKKEQIVIAMIRRGTVLDHLTPGSSPVLLSVLQRKYPKANIGIITNVKGRKRTSRPKDMIKIVGRKVDEREPDIMALLKLVAPNATVNIIWDEAVRKFLPALPKSITAYLRCGNETCVTNNRAEATPRFNVKGGKEGEPVIRCDYCENGYDLSIEEVRKRLRI